MTGIDRDRLIRLAIAPPDVAAPPDLADAIHAAVLLTPQRRPFPGLARIGLRNVPPALVALGLLVLLSLAAILVVLSRPPANEPLLGMYHGGPARTGLMPGPGPAGDNVVVRWDVQRNGPLGFSTMPLVTHGLVIVADDSGIVGALNAVNGSTVWEYDAGSSAAASPALAGGMVIAATAAGEVIGLTITEGQQVWRTSVDGPVTAALLVVQDVIYAGTQRGTLYALSAATGEVRWSLPTGAPITRGPAASGGILFVGSTGGNLEAIDLARHDSRWMVNLGEGEVGTPSVADGRVYVGRGIKAPDGPHDLVARSEKDGSALWSFATTGGQQAHMGGFADGVVYAIGEDGNVYALAADTGRGIWTSQTDGPIGTLAAIVGDTIYVTSTDRTVRALDRASGAQRWQVDIVGSPTMPAVSDGLVFVGTDLGRVVAIGAPAP